ncbi:hypothetical protein JCM19236_1041 [Vibrio sp. JCM 19236]|nr:hypothetical protein JCM19236_1041 [Vibrio sp. JCM 19236]
MADLTTYVLATLALIAIGGFVVGGIQGSRVGTKLGVFTTVGLAVLLAGGFTSDGNAAKPESDTNYKATYQHYWLMSCAYYFNGRDRRTIIEAVASQKENAPLDDHKAIKAAKADANVDSCENAVKKRARS